MEYIGKITAKQAVSSKMGICLFAMNRSIRKTEITVVEVLNRRNGNHFLQRFDRGRDSRLFNRLAIESRFNAQLDLRHDEAANVMRHQLAKHFIRHGYVRSRANRIAELGFAHAENGLRI